VFPGTRLEGLRFSCLRKSKPFALAGCFKLCLAHIRECYHSPQGCQVLNLLSRNLQPFDGLALDEVGFDDFRDVRWLYVAVPDIIRVNDHCGPELTGIQTPGPLGPDLFRKAVFGQLLLKQGDELFRVLLFATAPGMPRRAFVGAYKNMCLQFHG
jgi:hypothetical protein